MKNGLIVMNKKYILNEKQLNNFKKKIKSRDKILLFLDYDGTLAPFKPDPLAAFALPEIKNHLEKIEKSQKYELSLVSGRKLSQLKQMIKLKQSHYAGSHGLEIDLVFSNQTLYPVQVEKEANLDNSNYQKVKKIYSAQTGVEVEAKGFGLALHFNSQTDKKSEIKKIKELLKKDSYQVISGRQVIEIRPAAWDKGKAVNYISQQLKKEFKFNDFLRIYIGDDRTDEDAFKVLENGITIYVQNEADLETEAEFYLKNPKDTAKLLEVMAGYF
ncbi:MAG: trehalose-phosphatase [Bacillota bacterium]